MARLKGDVGRLNSEIAEARTRTSGCAETGRTAARPRSRSAERRIRLADLARLDVRWGGFRRALNVPGGPGCATVDQVHPDRRLRFTYRTTGSAGPGCATGRCGYETYYEAVILPDIEALAKLDQDLMPGMPVEAFLRTADRTPLQFLIQPLANYFKRAFREG